ncbi:DUF3502 domain-containing protein [Paenibacillus sp. GCM10023252]|uniref:DUF3502 domain-containing protein n=1 Tax=Paenibacillus sp. GCM10023252 TaxID=3252649 RepID=UPI00360F6509
MALRKQLLTVLVGIMGLTMAVAGCSGNNKGENVTPSSSANASTTAPSAEPAPELEEVKLKFVFIGPGEQKDMDTVETEVNNILKEKINATVDLQIIDFGSYSDRLNTMSAAGEEVDVVWTSNWAFPYKENVNKGAFIALDELIDKAAPELRTALPARVLEAAKVNGKIYAIPNYQLNFQREGFGIREDLVTRNNIDLKTVKTFEDLAPILETVKKSDPNVIPYAMDNRGIFGELQRSIGLQQVQTGDIKVAAVKWDDPSLKVVNVFETEAYKQHLQTVRDYYKKGYINQDAPTAKDLQAMDQAGLIGVMWGSGVSETRVMLGTLGKDGKKSLSMNVTNAITDTNGFTATMLAVSRNSKNPERALMLINLLNTDKKLYNLISWGIEGKHYTLDDQGRMKINPNGGYNPDIKWVFGNTFNSLLKETESVEAAAADQKMNDEAEVMPLSGFSFDSAPVTTELANLKTVIDEYEVPLRTGSVDPDKYYPIMLEKLNKAGLEKVIAEIQQQVDAWKAAK